MKIIDSNSLLSNIEKGWVLSIGNFDGLHLGLGDGEGARMIRVTAVSLDGPMGELDVLVGIAAPPPTGRDVNGEVVRSDTGAPLEGARVVEMPVHHRPRLHGRSKYAIGDRLIVAWADLCAVFWMKRRVSRYDVKELNRQG